MIQTQMAVRTALPSDHTAIANLIYFEPQVHRHLDWRGPLDWLGVKEYWVLEHNGDIVAALACPPDPEGVAWLRLFAHASDIPVAVAWDALWNHASNKLQGRSVIIAVITVADWLTSLLVDSGFNKIQQIVVLEQNFSQFEHRPIPANLTLRPMRDTDLPLVAEVDASGFAPLWRNSIPALQSGFLQAGFASVALINGDIIGYQLSTRSVLGVHLARLAVSARLQGRGIGYLLVQDLLDQSRKAGLQRVTVNTQADNRTSLALYHKIGFELTGDRYNVFTYRF